jgi:hypothetical protein
MGFKSPSWIDRADNFAFEDHRVPPRGLVEGDWIFPLFFCFLCYNISEKHPITHRREDPTPAAQGFRPGRRRLSMSERSAAFRRRMMYLKKKQAQHRLLLHSLSPTRRLVGIWSHTPRVCSCRLCGNPRRHLGQLPPQELKALLRWQAQIEEIDE